MSDYPDFSPETTERMNVERLLNMDRRWVFLLMALFVVGPTLLPVEFPVPTSSSTQNLYDRIEAMDEGSFVILSFGYGPSSMAELQPQVEAVMRHCFRKKARVMMMSLAADAPPLAVEALDKVRSSAEFAENGVSRLQPGADYVDVGFRVGFHLVILRMAGNIPGFFQEDTRGEPLETLPAMEGVSTFADVDLVIDFAAGDSADSWIVYGNEPHGVEVAAGVTGVIVSQLYPFLDSGQLKGLLGGALGGAEYETLVGAPGDGSKRVAVLSFAHFLVIGLVVFGNVLVLIQRSQGPKDPRETQKTDEDAEGGAGA